MCTIESVYEMDLMSPGDVKVSVGVCRLPICWSAAAIVIRKNIGEFHTLTFLLEHPISLFLDQTSEAIF
jgi:hypothetical protein